MIPAAQHLHLVVRHWPDLRDALATPSTTSWPPAMGITTYLAELDQLDAEEARQARELEVPAGAPPLRLAILDTMRSVEAALTELADIIAADVQRPLLRVETGRGWSDDLHRQAALLATRDSADPSRWRYTGQRTAPEAAAWLLARVQDQPGPFRPLHDGHRAHIARIAAEAAQRVETALQLTRKTAAVPWPCPHCRGELRVEGGDGATPAVRCTACGWTRTAADAA